MPRQLDERIWRGQLARRVDWIAPWKRLRAAKLIVVTAEHTIDWAAGARCLLPLVSPRLRVHRAQERLPQKTIAELVAFYDRHSSDFTRETSSTSTICDFETGDIELEPSDFVALSAALPKSDDKTLDEQFIQDVRRLCGTRDPSSHEARVAWAMIAAARDAGAHLNGIKERAREDEIAAEELIVKRVNALLGMECRIFSERRTANIADALRTAPKDECLLFIDAIDGRRNYERYIPLWTIGIGAATNSVERGVQGVCGVVFNVQTQELFVGISGGGAVLINEGAHRIQPLVPSKRSARNETLVATHLSTAERNLESSRRVAAGLMIGLPDVAYKIHMLGSGLQALTHVAAGRAEAFLAVNTNFYNVIPAKFILDAIPPQENGHCVTDFADMPWQPQSRSLLTSGNGRVHRKLLELLRKAWVGTADRPRV